MPIWYIPSESMKRLVKNLHNLKEMEFLATYGDYFKYALDEADPLQSGQVSTPRPFPTLAEQATIESK